MSAVCSAVKIPCVIPQGIQVRRPDVGFFEYEKHNADFSVTVKEI